MRYRELGCVSHRADDPEDKDMRRLNKTRRRMKRGIRRRKKEKGRQHAFVGPMAAEKRGRQTAVGGGHPAADRSPIRGEVRAAPPGEEEATTAGHISWRCLII
eukprot:10626-Pleurochrysis_carterae.AAC.1